MFDKGTLVLDLLQQMVLEAINMKNMILLQRIMTKD
jgi:hypothetical protein